MLWDTRGIGRNKYIGYYTEIAISRTARILLPNTHSYQKIIIYNYSFIHSSEVFHPAHSSTQIREVDKC